MTEHTDRTPADDDATARPTSPSRDRQDAHAAAVEGHPSSGVLRATRQDGTYPRPQLLRRHWADLCGPWEFTIDRDDVGLDAGWWTAEGPASSPFDATIQVPFAPESEASGVADRGPFRVVWYRRRITGADLDAAGFDVQGHRLLLHLGAVDHTADVWLGGHHVARHVGGQTPFTVDVTPVLLAHQRRLATGLTQGGDGTDGADASADGPGARSGGRWDDLVGPDGLTLVVRAEDDPLDVSQPRGKQDWKDEPHVIWYDRTTGIWQPVWLEAVPDVHLEDLAWEADVPDGSVLLTARLSAPPRACTTLAVSLHLGDELLAEQQVRVLDRDVRMRIDLPRQANGQQYEEILWSPERPTLVDAEVVLHVADDGLTGAGDAEDLEDDVSRWTHHVGPHVTDAVASYLGLRSVAVANGWFLLNDRPYYLRSVLEQGFWPQSLLTAPSADALREEVRLIKELGFNSARVHQKAEDPRFLYWCDRLGLTVWGETANAYAYSPRSVELLTHEWLELVRRDRSHPSVVTWVPLNESWGVQHGAHDVRQQHYGLGLVHLTKALDPTRPVVSNDGWEHTDSDIWSVHDYAERGDELRERYGTPEAVRELLEGIGPAGRPMRLSAAAPVPDRGQPLMLTEFGGVSYAGGRDDAWGYSTATDDDDFAARVGDLLDAVRACRPVVGFCWTQLTDTGQETNGLLHADRRPKLPVEVLRRLVVGDQKERPSAG
ncbi:glycoside hydrolase family 2 protein [Cellulomonas carbonis]|uniref:glycoside hydrolase family 2 protein n=1 Tax=Cellulomonas carbonis TaxID=1386092 RepID=UPI0009DE9FA4|nr:glycoside hydrolase family 2 TIM barrel-domain containing protein [Cellulomonas carbonis]GGC02671.1 beta-glucuronidase [Cellulomonas carbonis]